MPYKSDAQRRFFHAAEARGDIKKKTVDEFDRAGKGKKLPEHVEAWEGGMYSEGGYVQEADPRRELDELHKYAEGGLVEKEEGSGDRYDLQDALSERLAAQVHPDESSEEGSKHTDHEESPLPEAGFDEEMTQKLGEEYDEAAPDVFNRQNREFLDQLRKRRARRE